MYTIFLNINLNLFKYKFDKINIIIIIILYNMSITILPNTNDSIDDTYYIHNMIEFSIKDISSSLANTIRRTILSNIPSVAFDDTWNEHETKRYINITKNTSGLHNEFFAHRLSLIPIYVYNDNTRSVLKINTGFNKQTHTREYTFYSEDIPTFFIHIDKQEIKSNTDAKNKYGLFEMTTNHIQYSPEYSSDIDCSEYFPSDLYINEVFKEKHYVVLNMLKSNEEISAYLYPTIGLGKDNARYCNVGTVSFRFEEDDSKYEQVFTQTIEYENKERIEKQIHRLTDEEIANKKKSFMLLDKERVFKTDIYNEPNSFIFKVESIGMLPSHQIVYDAFTICSLQLQDIVHSFNYFEQYGNNVMYNDSHRMFNDKIHIVHSMDTLYGYKLIIQNENHTFGNVINHYIDTLFVKNYMTSTTIDINTLDSISLIDIEANDLQSFKVPFLEQCGYKMPHPLNEEVEFKIKVRDDIPDTIIDELYNKYSLELIQLYNIKQGSEDRTVTLIDKRKILVIYSFIKSILTINNILTMLSSQWTSETTSFKHPIQTSSFNIMDSIEFQTLGQSKVASTDIETPVSVELMETGGAN